MLKATSIKRKVGIILGLTVSLFLLVHLALLMFTDLTRSYHGFGIWIVFIILTAIAALCLLGSDKEDGK